MGDLISRITVIHRNGEHSDAVTVYREPRKRRRSSTLVKPLERATRHIIRSQVVFGQELLRRNDRANRRRRDGWLVDAPATVVESGRKAYNEARKAVPFRILPKC
jgi:hypothetical protein